MLVGVVPGEAALAAKAWPRGLKRGDASELANMVANLEASSSHDGVAGVAEGAACDGDAAGKGLGVVVDAGAGVSRLTACVDGFDAAGMVVGPLAAAAPDSDAAGLGAAWSAAPVA